MVLPIFFSSIFSCFGFDFYLIFVVVVRFGRSFGSEECWSIGLRWCVSLCTMRRVLNHNRHNACLCTHSVCTDRTIWLHITSRQWRRRRWRQQCGGDNSSSGDFCVIFDVFLSFSIYYIGYCALECFAIVICSISNLVWTLNGFVIVCCLQWNRTTQKKTGKLNTRFTLCVHTHRENIAGGISKTITTTATTTATATAATMTTAINSRYYFIRSKK